MSNLRDQLIYGASKYVPSTVTSVDVDTDPYLFLTRH